MFKKIILSAVIFSFVCVTTYAQEERDLNKEVEVKTTYQPKINKSKRIGELPTLVDTAKFTPSFNYFIQTKPLSVGFSPALIPAARIVGEPLKSVNSHALTLAGGNYATLFGDYRYNNQRSKTSDLGVHIRHYSTNGKVELANGDEVKPDWTEQLAEVYGKIYLDDSQLSGRVYYGHKGYNYYGETMGFNMNLFNYDSQKQDRFGLNADFKTTFKDQERLNFGIGLEYEHFVDDIITSENDLLIKAEAKIKRGEGLWSLTSEFDYFATDGLYKSSLDLLEERKTMVWNLNPQYSLQTGGLNLSLGVNAVIAMGDDSETKVYPDISIDFEAVDEILSIFAGLDGGLEMNRYNDIADENPFVYSGLHVDPTNTKYRLFGGIKGSLSSNSSFKLSAEYSEVENQYFFIRYSDLLQFSTGTEALVSNKFGIEHDDISLLRLGAEVTVGWTDKLQLNSSVWYNSYSMDILEDAWHKPEFEMNVNASYLFSDKLSFQAGVSVLGERTVSHFEYSSGIGGVSARRVTENLDAVYDLSIGANYRLNEHFTAFGKVNNLFADKYYQWDGYPSQRLNFLLGIKVVF